jgi:hypothetical protein
LTDARFPNRLVYLRGETNVAQAPIQFDAQVEEVLASFDFDRVVRVMEWLHWTWANLGRVPTRAELVAEAERLLRELNGEPGILGSGGLRASLKEDGALSLKFILCETWSDRGEEVD